MPVTVSGSPKDFKPDVDVGFRFDDAAFLVLTVDEQNAIVDQSAVRVAQYFKYEDPDDAGEPDAPTIFIPDLKGLAINIRILYNRDFGSAEPYFTIMVKFVDDPDQKKGISPGQVKARAEIVGQMIVDDIVAIESEESLPITATLTWL